ncbi:DUF2971 domain-containing protein [Shewanella putrefaciens]
MELCHYTDVTGLKGIIDNESIWATDIRFLNDREELFAGIEQVKRFLSKISSLSDITESSELSCKEELKLIKEFSKFEEFKSVNLAFEKILVKKLNGINCYISSFTDKRDNLRQWMSYCPSNAGYCIVFEKDNLVLSEREEHDSGYTANFSKVYYGNLEELLIEDYTEIINSFALMLSGKEDEVYKSIHKLVSRFLFHCCTFKNEEFSDESEIRIIMQSTLNKTNAREYRTKSGLLIPYMKYPTPIKSIKEIIIGPNINSELAKQGLEDYLHNKGVKCKVSQSACSLRVY